MNRCCRAAEVTNDDLVAYMQELHDTDRAFSSRALIAATICRFFRFLQEEGKIVRNPAQSLLFTTMGKRTCCSHP